MQDGNGLMLASSRPAKPTVPTSPVPGQLSQNAVPVPIAQPPQSYPGTSHRGGNPLSSLGDESPIPWGISARFAVAQGDQYQPNVAGGMQSVPQRQQEQKQIWETRLGPSQGGGHVTPTVPKSEQFCQGAAGNYRCREGGTNSLPMNTPLQTANQPFTSQSQQNWRDGGLQHTHYHQGQMQRHSSHMPFGRKTNYASESGQQRELAGANYRVLQGQQSIVPNMETSPVQLQNQQQANMQSLSRANIQRQQPTDCSFLKMEPNVLENTKAQQHNVMQSYYSSSKSVTQPQAGVHQLLTNITPSQRPVLVKPELAQELYPKPGLQTQSRPNSVSQFSAASFPTSPLVHVSVARKVPNQSSQIPNAPFHMSISSNPVASQMPPQAGGNYGTAPQSPQAQPVLQQRPQTQQGPPQADPTYRGPSQPYPQQGPPQMPDHRAQGTLPQMTGPPGGMPQRNPQVQYPYQNNNYYYYAQQQPAANGQPQVYMPQASQPGQSPVHAPQVLGQPQVQNASQQYGHQGQGLPCPRMPSQSTSIPNQQYSPQENPGQSLPVQAQQYSLTRLQHAPQPQVMSPQPQVTSLQPRATAPHSSYYPPNQSQSNMAPTQSAPTATQQYPTQQPSPLYDQPLPNNQSPDDQQYQQAASALQPVAPSYQAMPQPGQQATVVNSQPQTPQWQTQQIPQGLLPQGVQGTPYQAPPGQYQPTAHGPYTGLQNQQPTHSQNYGTVVNRGSQQLGTAQIGTIDLLLCQAFELEAGVVNFSGRRGKHSSKGSYTL